MTSPSSGKISRLAVASMVLGIASCSCFLLLFSMARLDAEITERARPFLDTMLATALFGGLILGILAIIFGIIALRNSSMEKAGRNRKFIITGIMTGTIASMIFFLPILNTTNIRPRRLSCASHLKQISLALEMYASDWGGAFPPSDNAKGLDILRSQGYLEDPKMYVCPSSGTVPAAKGETLTDEHVDYRYRGGLSLEAGPGTALAWDKDNNHAKFGNILFLDALPHVSGFVGKNWQDNLRDH